MRLATVVVIAAAALGGRARAQCPPVCLPGGGPARTDCVDECGGLPGATSRLQATAVSGGLHDTDKLTLTCQPNPAPPSFSAAVLPILSAKCALPSCHSGPSPSGGQNLEPAHAYAESVGVASINLPHLMRV